jgi:stress response protein YsnF
VPEKAPPGETVIPLAEERVAITKREVETGRVRVALTTETETVVARETLRGRRVEIKRVPVNRMLPEGEPAPQSREEGDTLVVPVVEEVAVVVRRLVLREEVRLRFVATEVAFEQEVALRRQRAVVERDTPASPEQAPPTPPTANTTAGGTRP